MGTGKQTPLLVIVGSKRAGRMTHLKRLVREGANRYRPVRTVTDQAVEAVDAEWYIQRPPLEVWVATSLTDFLAMFYEEYCRYTVLRPEVVRAHELGGIPLVGMSMDGLEHLAASAQTKIEGKYVPRIDYRAVVLTPEHPERFAVNLIAEGIGNEEDAWLETQRAIRESTLPPAACTPSVIPLPVNGDAKDQFRLYDVLSKLF